MPVLSETEISAFIYFLVSWGSVPQITWKDRAEDLPRKLLDKPVFQQLLAQRIAVQPQPFGRLGLILLGLRHHDFEQRLFHHLDQHFVHAVGFGAAQVPEVTLQAGAHAFFDVLLAHTSIASSSPASGAVAGIRSVMPASSSKNAATACNCPALSSTEFIRARKAAPPGSAFTYQPMCLRALRTPVNSPYRP